MDDTTKKILEIVTEIQEDVGDIRKRMAAKDELKAVHDSLQTQLESTRKDLQAQITANTQAIAELSEQLRGVFGYAKEIDALMSRVSAIEKHVGIAK